MAKNIRFVMGIITILLLSVSCASMRLQTVSKPLDTKHLTAFNGKSLSIDNIDVSLEASRAEFDIRGTKVTINDQTFTLGDTYLERIDDVDLGEVGIVDTNIFKKAGINEEEMTEKIAEALLTGLSGGRDLAFLINPEKPDVGVYSNRKVIYDFSTYPYSYEIDHMAEELNTVFSSVQRNDLHADIVLNLMINVRSEIFQILNDDVYIQNRHISESHQPEKGDYYLSVFSYIEFELLDRNSGRILMDEKTPLAYPAAYNYRKNLYIPIKGNDEDEYSRFFRDFNFGDYTTLIAEKLTDQMVPGLRPVYQNLNMFVKVEEEE